MINLREYFFQYPEDAFFPVSCDPVGVIISRRRNDARELSGEGDQIIFVRAFGHSFIKPLTTDCLQISEITARSKNPLDGRVDKDGVYSYETVLVQI